MPWGEINSEGVFTYAYSYKNVSARTEKISTQNLIFCLTKSAPLLTGIQIGIFQKFCKNVIKSSDKKKLKADSAYLLW